jgi:arylsulfatase A-like enzyme
MTQSKNVLLFTAIIALLLQSPQLDAAAPRPNIVLCMADDQGWGDVAYNGHPVLKTPHMDAMAAEALRLDRFYAAAPVCSPTRGSVLTGRHPNRFGCFAWGHRLRPQELTVAEALKTAGYRTGHFGKWHLGSLRADSPDGPGGSGFDEWFSSPNFYENNPLFSHRGKVIRTKGEGSAVTAELAIDFIRDATKRKTPFLAVVWFGSPHSPHVAIDEDRKLYADQPKRLQHFYGEITAMDRAVGRLRKELRDLDIADNTVFWYTSDNGAINVGSTGGLSGRKGSLLEGGIRVPTIIEWPAVIKSPRRSSVPCGTVDIYPTLLALAGAKVEKQVQPLDGISLIDLIEGRMESRTKPLGFWTHPTRGRSMRSSQILQALEKEQPSGAKKSPPPAKIAVNYPVNNPPGHAAWIDGRYKLHRYPGKGTARYKLFDLEKDPKEQRDLSAEQTERVNKMKAALAAWQKSVIGSMKGEDYK